MRIQSAELKQGDKFIHPETGEVCVVSFMRPPAPGEVTSMYSYSSIDSGDTGVMNTHILMGNFPASKSGWCPLKIEKLENFQYSHD